MTSVVAIAPEDLATVDLFAGLSASVLVQCAAVTAFRDVEAGEVLADQGETAPGLLILLKGTIGTWRVDGDRVEAVDRYEGPAWMAAVAVITGEPMPVRVRARTPCRIGLMPSSDFRGLAASHGAVRDRVTGRIASVYTRVSANDAMRDRLSAVNTMAAGPAHELNNPVAAAQRAARELGMALAEVQHFSGLLVSGVVERDAAAQLLAPREEARRRAATAGPAGSLAVADAEEALVDALRRPPAARRPPRTVMTSTTQPIR